MFEDRTDAGKALGTALAEYQIDDPIVLAIPRGGVEVAYHVARELGAELSLVIVRKLPLPANPEAGFGAVAEDGSAYLDQRAAYGLTQETIQRIIQQQRKEVSRRIEVLRRNEPLPDLAGRSVVLVDDGIAMGSTIRAAIELCKHQDAGRIVVAVPVTGERTAREIGALVDGMVVLEKPPFFRAVAQVYRNWYDVSDSEVLSILEEWRRERRSKSGEKVGGGT